MCLQESSADLAALEQLLAESKAEAELTALLAGDDGLAALNTLLAEQAASLDAWRAALERQADLCPLCGRQLTPGGSPADHQQG